MNDLRQVNSTMKPLSYMDEDDKSLYFPLSISQLACAAQTTVHTVRNYVSEGLLCCCDHTSAGYGLYNRSALIKLRFIRTARDAGLMIVDIKPLLKILNSENQIARDAVFRSLQVKIVEKKERLHYLEKQLTYLEKL